ncbi:MAG: class I SAM-dependent methyltransferase [Candidatus Omnitrophota bacterium]
MQREINAQVYDQNVLLEGIQTQIDNYYEPKSLAQQRRIKIVMSVLAAQAEEKILDIGSGVGTFAYAGAKCKAVVFGIDYSHESMKVATLLADKFNTKNKSFFITASALALPYQNACFDKIVCADFIEHITDTEKNKLLTEIYRVLKPSGMGVIFTPNLIREKIGKIYHRIRNLLFKTRIPETDLHFGLITKSCFDVMLKNNGFNFDFFYADTTRPYLAKIPFLNNFLALNLIWIIRKK